MDFDEFMENLARIQKGEIPFSTKKSEAKEKTPKAKRERTKTKIDGEATKTKADGEAEEPDSRLRYTEKTLRKIEEQAMGIKRKSAAEVIEQEEKNKMPVTIFALDVQTTHSAMIPLNRHLTTSPISRAHCK